MRLVTVGPCADVTGRVDGLSAELAGRPAGGDDGQCAFGECPGDRSGHADPQQRRAVGVVVLDEDFLLGVGVDGLRFDDDLLSLRIPAEPECTDTECLDNWLVQGRVVVQVGRCDRGTDATPPETRTTSSSMASNRSASTATWAFSKTTLVSRSFSRT